MSVGAGSIKRAAKKADAVKREEVNSKAAEPKGKEAKKAESETVKPRGKAAGKAGAEIYGIGSQLPFYLL